VAGSQVQILAGSASFRTTKKAPRQRTNEVRERGASETANTELFRLQTAAT
jgi:hypothetical protein